MRAQKHLFIFLQLQSVIGCLCHLPYIMILILRVRPPQEVCEIILVTIQFMVCGGEKYLYLHVEFINSRLNYYLTIICSVLATAVKLHRPTVKDQQSVKACQHQGGLK